MDEIVDYSVEMGGCYPSRKFGWVTSGKWEDTPECGKQ